MSKHLTCRICDSTNHHTTYKAKELMFGIRDSFNYFQCIDCNCLQIEKVPPNLSDYYPKDYYSFNHRDEKAFKGFSGFYRKFQYSNSLFGSRLYEKSLGRLIDKDFFHLFKPLKLNKQSRILDVGSGDGKNFIYPLSILGFKHVLGIDPFLPEDILYNNGLKVKKQTIGEVQGTWDLITFHHSFEHVPDPYDHLQNANRLLKSGATCMIAIPTSSSYAWEHYRENWSQLDSPRHLFLHSKESIDLMAEKTGFEVYKTVYNSGHFQFTGSELYKRDIALNEFKRKKGFGYLKRKITKLRYTQKAKNLNKQNKGDQAVFYLRKC